MFDLLLCFQILSVVYTVLSRVWLFAAPWTIAHQAPLSMDFPGESTGVGCHLLLRGIFLTQGWNLGLLCWQADSLPLSHQGSPFLKLKEY